ncbi:hypothetical protein HB779_09370 [Phyllobacterium sp. 628]|uniref:hypothetical protein n=1 Tax=Phyllobacterium sp. 628 TaxID=2718938 RepID=UPI0016624153|nr:hypothetical protein [Phyllobacterium sp. 628]QND52092.1 hypothetical protein HB779_09370 [Phyllobacterium sp. 628]
MPTIAINLRNKAIAERLFAYPNEGHENDTLEETIHHYFSDSLSREGLANFTIAPGGDDAGYLVQITLADASVAEQISITLSGFF